jgi:hypothetical protein
MQFEQYFSMDPLPVAMKSLRSQVWQLVHGKVWQLVHSTDDCALLNSQARADAACTHA